MTQSPSSKLVQPRKATRVEEIPEQSEQRLCRRPTYAFRLTKRVQVLGQCDTQGNLIGIKASMQLVVGSTTP